MKNNIKTVYVYAHADDFTSHVLACHHVETAKKHRVSQSVTQ